LLRGHPPPDLRGSGRARSGPEAVARPPCRIVRGRRLPRRRAERAPAQDRRAARGVHALRSQVMSPQAERLTLPVRGMHCAACVGKVERALTSVPGVDEATVNLATEKATVTFDSTRTDVTRLQDAVARAGYELVEPREAAGQTPDRDSPPARKCNGGRARTSSCARS